MCMSLASLGKKNTYRYRDIFAARFSESSPLNNDSMLLIVANFPSRSATGENTRVERCVGGLSRWDDSSRKNQNATAPETPPL